MNYNVKVKPGDVSPDEYKLLRWQEDQQRRMNSRNAREGYRAVKSQVADYDYQRPNFSSDQEYEEYLTKASLASELEQRILAKRADKDGMVLGYTPEQENQRAHLEAARARLYSRKDWTPEQMLDADRSLRMKENQILPSWVKKPPTMQDKINESIVQLPGGGLAYVDDKGKINEINGNAPPFKDWMAAKVAIKEAYTREETDAKGNVKYIEPSDDEASQLLVKEFQNYQRAWGIASGVATQGQQGGEQQPQQGTNMGLAEQPQLAQQIELPEEGRVTWNDLTTEEQERSVNAVMAEQARQIRSETNPPMGSMMTGDLMAGGGVTRRTRTQRGTKEDAREMLRADPEFLKDYIGDMRKPGTLPRTLKEATRKERDIMYANYEKNRPKFKKAKTQKAFEAELSSEDIMMYLPPATEEQFNKVVYTLGKQDAEIAKKYYDTWKKLW